MIMTTTIDELMAILNVRDEYQLRRVLERKLPESEVYNVPFMPLTQTSARKIKLRVRIGTGAGLASFKADNALTPVVSDQGSLQELLMELVTISEKEVLNASDLIKLNSPDARVKLEGVRNVVDRARHLKLRNLNRTKWMAWKAAKDELTITYPSGASVGIDFDLDGDSQNDWFSGSHLPTAGTDWDHQDADNDYDADIVTDVYNWSKLIADDLGCAQDQVRMHLHSETWRYVRRNSYLLKESNPALPQPRTAPLKTAEVADILDLAAVEVVNSYYLGEDDGMTKVPYLSEGEVLFTGPYNWQGDPIAEMLDGPVVQVEGENLTVRNNPGMVPEIYISKEQQAQNVRVTSARMAVLNYPAAFVLATVS
jgi:hypothetical protein